MRLADTAQRAIVGGCWSDGEKVGEKEREKVPLWNVCGKREIERELIEIKSVCDNIEGE